MQQDIQVVKAKAVVATEYLARQGFDVKNTVILEMLARIEGFRNWSAYRETLEITPAITNSTDAPPTEHEALTMCYRWLCSAPIEELEAVEQALGETAPMAMAADALNAAAPAEEEEAQAEDESEDESAVDNSPWSPIMGEMSDGQYLARKGVRCPSCGAYEVTGRGRVDAENGEAWQPLECDACNAQWNDVYKLVGYGELEGGIDLEAVQAVVEDVKERAQKYEFSVSTEDRAREAVVESTDLLELMLNQAEQKVAVMALTS